MANKMKKAPIVIRATIHSSIGDWICPHCGQNNNTESPQKVVQCTGCLELSELSNWKKEGPAPQSGSHV